MTTIPLVILRVIRGIVQALPTIGGGEGCLSEPIKVHSTRALLANVTTCNISLLDSGCNICLQASSLVKSSLQMLFVNRLSLHVINNKI